MSPADLIQRAEDIHDLLRDSRPDAIGECDRCHCYPVELTTEHGQPGEFAYCVRCWRQIARACVRRAKIGRHAALSIAR